MGEKMVELMEKLIKFQVRIFGEWGGVCDDGFTPTEGEIVCNQLGYTLGVEKVYLCFII